MEIENVSCQNSNAVITIYDTTKQNPQNCARLVKDDERCGNTFLYSPQQGTCKCIKVISDCILDYGLDNPRNIFNKYRVAEGNECLDIIQIISIYSRPLIPHMYNKGIL